MTTEIEILQYLHYHPLSRRTEIAGAVTSEMSDRTLKRIIADAVGKGYIKVIGKGPATKYKLTPQAHVTMPLDLDTYFDRDIDGRQIQECFNFELIREVLPAVHLFDNDELEPVMLRQAVWVEYKGWWFWKRVKAVHQTISSDNPYAEIRYSEYICIRK